MAKTVVGIDIGHGSNSFPPSKGIYKNGKAYEEHDFNSLVGIRLGELLKHNGFKVVYGQKPNSPDVPLGERKDIYVANGADLVVSVHANYNNNEAVNGRCVFYWNTNSSMKDLAQNIVSKFKDLGYGTHGSGLHASRLNSWTNLFITRSLPMDSILIEHGFMSGSRDFSNVFGSNQAEHVEDMAQADAEAIVEHFGKSYKSTGTKSSKPSTGTIHRVQVGAFKEASKVAEFADEVERKTNFDTYVTDSEGYLKVQVGAFSKKGNANKRLSALKKAGYKDAFITTKAGKSVSNLEPYNEPADRKPKKPWKEVAQEVYEGTGGWGNNPGRKNKLEAQGYDYDQVQSEVNRLAKGGAPKNKARKVGERVTISNSAKTYATGEAIPNRIKGNTYTVQQVKTHRVLLKEIYSWVRKSDLINY